MELHVQLPVFTTVTVDLGGFNASGQTELLEKLQSSSLDALDERPLVEQVSACLANADFPVEDRRLEAALHAYGWGRATQVAYLAAIAFHVALLSFGFGFALWSIPMIAASTIPAGTSKRTKPGRRSGCAPQSRCEGSTRV